MNTLGQLHGTQTSRDRVVLFLLFFSREIYIFCKSLVMKERRKEEGNKNTLAAIFCVCLVIVSCIFFLREASKHLISFVFDLERGLWPFPFRPPRTFLLYTSLFLFLGIRHFPSSHPQLHWLFFSSSSSLYVFQAPPLSLLDVYSFRTRTDGLGAGGIHAHGHTHNLFGPLSIYM